MKAFFKCVYKLLGAVNVKIAADHMSRFTISTSTVRQISALRRNKTKYGLAALLLTSNLQAAPLTIIPNAPGNLVTAGIPFAACALPDVSKFKLLNETGVEVQIFIKPTLFWPASKCNGVATIRAAKIQFAYNAAQGQKVYDWQLAPRSLPDLVEAPVAEIVSANPMRAPYKEPAFFAINDPSYLVSTGLIPPTTVAGANDYDRVWYPTAFEKRVRTTDFRTTDSENWLFDSVSAIYQQALRSGSPEQYREAYLEHEFWIGHMEVVTGSQGKSNVPPTPNFCIGGFDLGGVTRPYSEQGAGCDGKYTYLTPMKLHLALTGDDSWTPQENGTPVASAKDRATIIDTIADRAFTADWSRTCGLIAPYTNIGCAFTERNIGFALQQMVAAYELTGDSAVLANLTTAINNMYGMITNNPDKAGSNGYLSHSWTGHEGWYPAYLGSNSIELTASTKIIVTNLLGDDWKNLSANAEITGRPYGATSKLSGAPILNADGTLTLNLAKPVTMKAGETIAVISNGVPSGWVYSMKSDRAFSPWMQAIIADGLWQLYNITGDVALQAKISEILLGFGRAVTAYAIDGSGLAPAIKSQIESAFGVKVVSSSVSGSRGIVPYTRYVANALMGGQYATKQYIDYLSYDGGYSDQHSPEALFQIALAIKFETDPAKKAAMTSVADALTRWFSSANVSKTILGSHPARYFNWTNKQNAWGTYDAVKGNTDGPIISLPEAAIKQINNLVIAPNEILTNTVLLSDPVINGTLIGGSISGNVKNTKGTIQDVNLLAGTVVHGGIIKGRIAGAGIITDAILDATEVSSGIWLGSGVKITAKTLGSIQGKNLVGLVVNEYGELDFSTALLIDAQQNELSVLDLVKKALNKHFANNATLVKGDNANGLIFFNNNAFDNSYVAIRPISIKAASTPDSIATNHRGDFVISSSGIAITFSAAPQDLNAFKHGLSAINAVEKYFGNGLIEVDVSGSKYAFRISQQYLQEESQESNKVSAVTLDDTAAVSFFTEGNISNPKTYRIKSIYADGSVQELLPYVHDIDGFDTWMIGAGYTYAMDATDGFVDVYYKNTLVWRGIPSYNIVSNQTQQELVQILDGGDVNNDGHADYVLSTPSGNQVMFTLPMK